MTQTITFVVRDDAGRPRRWGACQPQMFAQQAGPGETVEEWAGGEIPEPAQASAEIEAREAAMHARRRRDELLRQSDWTQVPDAPVAPTERAAWAAFRRKLRDLPQQAEFPRRIAWPTHPDPKTRPPQTR